METKFHEVCKRGCYATQAIRVSSLNKTSMRKAHGQKRRAPFMVACSSQKDKGSHLRKN